MFYNLVETYLICVLATEWRNNSRIMKMHKSASYTFGLNNAAFRNLLLFKMGSPS